MSLGHTRHVFVVFAFWLPVSWAVAPTQKVSNVRFQDTNSDGGWISGTVRWDPPANVEGFTNYAVLILNSMPDIIPSIPAPPGNFKGAWYLCGLGKSCSPVGTNELTIGTLQVGADQANFPRRGSRQVQPQTRRRYAWGESPDRYLAVSCMNAQKEHGPAVVIPLYDKSRIVPQEHLNNVSFTDTNGLLGVLDGRVSWDPGSEGDFTLTQKYSVYLANDDAGTNEMKVGESNVPTFELLLTGYSRGTRDFFRIRGVNSNGASVWSTSLRLFDLGPSAPSVGVSNLVFTDTDDTQGVVAGTVTWTPPDDEAPISSYRIFLSDMEGSGGMLTPDQGYRVPVGTNQFVLPSYETSSFNAPDYIQIYSENDKGKQSQPTVLAMEDRTGV